MMHPEGRGVCGLPEEDVFRARFYGFLAHLLAAPPSQTALLVLCRLQGDETDLGRALSALAMAAQGMTPAAAEDEFNALFIGLTEGELRPYASCYLTGFLYEKPLADLRSDMRALGIRRTRGAHEPEDHIASLCEIMRGLIFGTFGRAADLETQKAIFDAHLQPWASRFFEDLERAKRAAFYRPIGAVGRTFIAIEREAFAMIARGDEDAHGSAPKGGTSRQGGGRKVTGGNGIGSTGGREYEPGQAGETDQPA